MEGNYEVRFGNRIVGTVKVYRQGLYYQFCCRCSLSGDVICRLKVQCGRTELDLGILVPMGDYFGIDTKIPVKQLAEGELYFTIGPKHIQNPERFIEVYPEEPFAYVERLKELFLVKSGGKTGLSIKEPGRYPSRFSQISSSRPTGQ